MNLMLILPSIVAAFSVLLLIGGIALSRRDQTVSERLDSYLGGSEQPAQVPNLVASQPFADRVIWPLMRRVARLFAWLLPQNRVNALRARLTMAGDPGGVGPFEFIGIKGLVLSATLGLAVLFGALSAAEPTFFNLLLLGLLGFCSFMLPDIWLSRRITQRQQSITNDMPDALDLLVIASAAGLSFENAMLEITNKMKGDLAREFGRALRDIGMGQTRRQALTGLADRTGVPDVASFVSAIKQAESLGVSIGRVLTVQAEEMRTKRRQRAQERANQAPVKMMFPLVFLIFPAIFAVLLGPAVPEILRAFGGVAE
jgi:tight adherence protein C